MPSRKNSSLPSDLLPADIWFRIAVLVPFDEFSSYRLYALNRYFLLFYLQETYKQVQLRFNHGSGCHRPLLAALFGAENTFPATINRISSPMAPGLVRNLDIEIREQFQDNPCGKGIAKLIRTMVRFVMWWGWLESSIREAKSWFRSVHCGRVRRTFSHLGGLNTINIKICYTSHNGLPVLPLGDFISRTVSPAWRASRGTLTSLSFNFEATTVPNIGLNDLDTFPNLETFEFLFRPSWHTLVFNEAFEKMVEESRAPLSSFLHRHATGLRTLSLSFPTCRFASNIINDIPYMQKLSSLSLHLCPTVTDTRLMDGLSRVLSIHYRQIEQLWLYLRQRVVDPWPEDLDNAPPGWWEQQKFMNIELPSIKFLCIYFLNKSAMYRYVSRLAPNVETLYLDIGPEWGLRSNHISDFTSQSFPTTLQNGCHLHTLALAVFTFTPDILKLFATHFPNLKVLRIRHYRVGFSDNLHPEEPEHALVRFSREPLNLWRLEELFLYNFNESRAYGFRMEEATYRSALATLLPNVKYFNGVRREDFNDPDEIESIPSGGLWPNMKNSGQMITVK